MSNAALLLDHAIDALASGLSREDLVLWYSATHLKLSPELAMQLHSIRGIYAACRTSHS